MSNTSPPTRSPVELNALAEEIGRFIEYWGFKRIHGRVWAHLYLSREPLDATTLSKRLKVSKTLMSFTVAELLKYDVIEEAGRGPRSRVYLRANPDLQKVIFGVLKQREAPMLARIEAACRALEPQKSTVDSSRAESLLGLIQAAKSALSAFMAVGEQHSNFTDTLNSLD